ncbi:MAG TPA: HAD family hydrolase [Pusillimonas sp.]|uniref:HAD family hydrolase n=1 Tax=Pusillimonas sp. TaxID=3040095 RepID=UPI002B4ADF40|nr:HAD family hydrolase [Pusillimonas sp.]HLU19330.1 HAD family hydrolase [Pusillimonas sp.]
MTTPKNLALFDLDHTLLPLDSDYQWADFLARTGRAGDPVEAQRLNNELMERYNAGNLTAQEAAEFMLGLLAAATTSELMEWHRIFMRDVIEPNILPVARALVDQHLQRGDLCAIVTATNEFVTAPIARAFNIPHLIATVPEMRDGRYTGAIAGVPSFQEGKVTRVNAWLDSQGLSLHSFERSYFYSDSTNDLPLLEAVTHPIAANPSPTLRQVAETRGWPILDIFKDMQDAKS